MKHLSWDVLGNGQPDDVRGGVEITNDPSDLSGREASWFGSEPEYDFVAVHYIYIQVKGDAGAAGAA